MKIYNKDSIRDLDLEYPDIYFTPEYGRACEISDKGTWYCFVSDEADIICPVIKKDDGSFSSPYGYSGIYCISKSANIDSFITELKDYNIHFRISPYLNSILKPNIPFKSETFGIELNITYDQYFKDTGKSNKRSIKKSINNNFTFSITEFNKEYINTFTKIYNETMNRLSASNAYYYSTEYYNELINSGNCLIALVLNKDRVVVAACLIFRYKDLLHYHLGGSNREYQKYGINNFLHTEVARYGIKNGYKLYHLGGGVTNNDSLHKFKKSISNISFKYYKGIENEDWDNASM